MSSGRRKADSMNKDGGAAFDCASFAVTAKGFAGSYGAAMACLEIKEVPEGVRRDVWAKLKAWAERKAAAYEGAEVTAGVHSLLWDIGREGYGFRIGVRDIPLEQEAVEIAEALGLNIYELRSADFSVELCGYPVPAEAAVIGIAGKGRDKILVNGEDESFLNRPEKQEETV